MSVETEGAQRLDKWLWFARVVKTRTLASRLVEAGKVRINRERTTKPSRTVRAGDVLTLALRGRVRVLKIVAPGARRGPAAEASTLYEDLTPDPGPAPVRPLRPFPAAARTPGAGRPTKRDRRRIEAWTRPSDASS
ncbi:MAG: RNA-binding S4 domain-containing protein [Hyphomicrobiales bacterium]|nr:RNA-binding S4 domain-containing protein [Hyphomicrobiales bacterium]